MTTAHITLTAELQDRPIASLRTKDDHTDKRESMNAFINEFRGILAGRRAMVRSCIASACASSTATLVQASISANDTITIAGVVLTAKSSGANLTSEWNNATSDTVSAANLATLINANTSTQKVVRASSSAGVVTITCVFPGPVGNEVRLTKSSAGITVTGSGFLASGASDEVDIYQLGFTPAT